MRRVLLATMLVVAFAAVGTGHAFAAGERSIGVSAADFKFEAAAGEAGEGEVWISNEGEEPVTVRVYASDQVVDDEGTVTYVTPSLDTNPLQSPASWMTVKLPPNARSLGNIPYVDLGVGEKVKVVFRVDIPEGAIPGDHNILLFTEMFDPTPSAAGGTARVFGRLGTRVKARVEGEIIEDLEIAPFTMPAYVFGATVPYDFTITNKGNVDERVTVRMVELDSSGTELSATVIATDTAVFAGKSLQRSDVVDGSKVLGRTTYRLEVTYPSQTTGANGLVKTVDEERSTWLIPAWLPYAIGVVLLVLLAAAIWSSGRRSATRRAEREQAEAAQEPE